MVKVFNSENYPSITGTFRVGTVNATYRDLVNALGNPTDDEESGDGKVQFTWVCKFKGELFTIYDWKTYDREYSEYELDSFNIGGKTNAESFIRTVEEKIEEYNNTLV